MATHAPTTRRSLCCHSHTWWARHPNIIQAAMAKTAAVVTKLQNDLAGVTSDAMEVVKEGVLELQGDRGRLLQNV